MLILQQVGVDPGQPSVMQIHNAITPPAKARPGKKPAKAKPAAPRVLASGGDRAPRRSALDDDKPRSHNRTLRTAATSARSGRWWRRASRWWWSRTALGLEEIRVVRHRINGDRLRAGERGDSRHHRVLVGRILVDDRDVTLAPIRNVNQLFRRIPSQGVHARAVRDGRHDLARARIKNDGCL